MIARVLQISTVPSNRKEVITYQNLFHLLGPFNEITRIVIKRRFQVRKYTYKLTFPSLSVRVSPLAPS